MRFSDEMILILISMYVRVNARMNLGSLCQWLYQGLIPTGSCWGKRSKGIGVFECGSGRVKVGFGALWVCVCISMCVCLKLGTEGGWRGQIVPSAEWSYFQASVHLLPWQQQWPRCCHGEVDTKRRGVGTGPGVRSEGRSVRGHSQLDSTQEAIRVRKEGGKVSFSFSFFAFSSLGFSALEGDVRRVDTTGH